MVPNKKRTKTKLKTGADKKKKIVARSKDFPVSIHIRAITILLLRAQRPSVRVRFLNEKKKTKKHETRFVFLFAVARASYNGIRKYARNGERGVGRIYDINDGAT